MVSVHARCCQPATHKHAFTAAAASTHPCRCRITTHHDATSTGFILGTGKLLIKVPPTMRFVMDGEMPEYLLAKDLILNIIGEISVRGPADLIRSVREGSGVGCAWGSALCRPMLGAWGLGGWWSGVVGVGSAGVCTHRCRIISLLCHNMTHMI